MSDTVLMPQLGETVAEGKILAWFKSVGDEIKEGDNLFEVETDKVTIEIQAVVSGRLNEIRVCAGDVAKVGAIVAVIGAESQAKPAPKPEAEQMAAPKAAPWRNPFEEVSTPKERFGPAKGPDNIRVTPLARRLIAQNNLDITRLAAEVKQRGGSRIDEQLVRSAMDASPPTLAPVPAPDAPRSAAPATPLSGQTITLNAVRLKTADRLAENWRTIPHVFQAIEVDFTAIDRVRGKHKQAFQEAHGFSLTYLPFIARATCLAIQAFPQVNVRFDGKSLSLSPTVGLGVAVDLSHNGLVVPVVRNAEDLTVAGLAKAMRASSTRPGRANSVRTIFRGALIHQQQWRLRNDFHGADHQCAASCNSFDRRHPVEARCGVDAGRRIRCATHDGDGRTEL